jgi:hypothetical protein
MYWLLVFLVLLTACSAPASNLDVTVLHPGEDSEMKMGESTRLTVQVTDAQGDAVSEAQVAITVRDPESQAVATIPALHGGNGIYRTDYWTLPHRVLEGTWNLSIEVETDSAQGSCSSRFKVKNSTSEILLAKYGFWLDAPDLFNARLQIGVERGDARNGVIRWGGGLPGMHITLANYVEVHWREGNYNLEDSEAVRRFVLEEGLGDLGDLRSIDLIQPIQFKNWDAWQAECRTYSWEEMEIVIFYAPEVDKTYAVATIVALPPVGLDSHEILRSSFAVFPDVHATGVAPKPLPRLLPGPELIGPPLAARFQGAEQPITLQWKPVKELAEDEYYEVVVDYWYRETRPVLYFATQRTQVTLPETLYRSPNCGVISWRVTLKRQTGLGDDGQPKGEPISHQSLYRYFWWQYPPGEEKDFPPLCPYTHID